jgi:hypothetical protein
VRGDWCQSGHWICLCGSPCGQVGYNANTCVSAFTMYSTSDDLVIVTYQCKAHPAYSYIWRSNFAWPWPRLGSGIFSFSCVGQTADRLLGDNVHSHVDLLAVDAGARQCIWCAVPKRKGRRLWRRSRPKLETKMCLWRLLIRPFYSFLHSWEQACVSGHVVMFDISSTRGCHSTGWVRCRNCLCF